MSKRQLKLSRTADVIEYGLVREILHRCGYGAVRDGDDLKVYNKSMNGSLYVNESEREECKFICDIYVDEGYQDDCLMSDGRVGMNRPWMEMCSMNKILMLLIDRLDPDREFEPSPYMGRGWSARHYHKQYVDALDEFREVLEVGMKFDWPEAPPPACNQTAAVV